jgi:hypothetical protein
MKYKINIQSESELEALKNLKKKSNLLNVIDLVKENRFFSEEQAIIVADRDGKIVAYA